MRAKMNAQHSKNLEKLLTVRFSKNLKVFSAENDALQNKNAELVMTEKKSNDDNQSLRRSNMCLIVATGASFSAALYQMVNTIKLVLILDNISLFADTYRGWKNWPKMFPKSLTDFTLANFSTYLYRNCLIWSNNCILVSSS